MSKRIFSSEEIKILSQNKYVKNISEKAITYTDEFKRIFLSERQNGKFAKQIFLEHGLDVNILGARRIRSACSRWDSAYKENSVLGLQDTRKENSGRPRIANLSIEEKYDRLKLKLKLLEAENELLKKLDMLERKAKR
jgi:transposase